MGLFGLNTRQWNTIAAGLSNAATDVGAHLKTKERRKQDLADKEDTRAYNRKITLDDRDFEMTRLAIADEAVQRKEAVARQDKLNAIDRGMIKSGQEFEGKRVLARQSQGAQVNLENVRQSGRLNLQNAKTGKTKPKPRPDFDKVRSAWRAEKAASGKDLSGVEDPGDFKTYLKNYDTDRQQFDQVYPDEADGDINPGALDQIPMFPQTGNQGIDALNAQFPFNPGGVQMPTSGQIRPSSGAVSSQAIDITPPEVYQAMFLQQVPPDFEAWTPEEQQEAFDMFMETQGVQ